MVRLSDIELKMITLKRESEDTYNKKDDGKQREGEGDMIHAADL